MKTIMKRSISFLLMMTMLFGMMAIPANALSFESITYNMTEEEIDEAIAEATTDTVTVAISDVSPSMTVNVPASGIKKIANSGKTLTVKTTDSCLIVNQEVLMNVAGQIGDTGNVVLSNKIFPSLTSQQTIALLKHRPLLYLRTTMTYNNKQLSLGDGGYITAKLYSDTIVGINVTEYTVAHWADNGTLTEIETVYEDGALVAQLDKLAVYAVIKRSTPLVCKHDVQAIAAVAPTCTETGLTEGAKCSNCGDVLTAQEVVPALGHSYEEGKCTVCGAADPDYVAPTPTPTPTPEPIENPFNDVSESDWFYNPVLWAVQNGITGGLGEGIFGPYAPCTRGQVVTFLWAAAGKPEPTSLNNPFKDVSESDYFFKPVLWAVENGITGGLGEGIFGPHESCTRGQIVTFLWASQGKPEVTASSTFDDVADTDWYAKPVIWAAENEVTGGIAPGQFGPNNTCTRGQVVTFLYKVYG